MSSHGLRLPESTRQRLQQFRQKVRLVKIAEGILAGLLGLVLSYLAVFILDRFVDTSAMFRIWILIAGSFGLAVALPWKCHRWVWGTRRMEQVAVLVKHRFPALGDQLLGIVELAHSERDPGASLKLAQAAIDQVDSVVREKDFSDAVPHPRHRFWAGTLAVPATIALLALALVPAAGLNALKRWLMPWSHTTRYTFAQVDNLPDQIIVPHGEEFSFDARLTKQTRWAPATATAGFRKQPVVQALKQNSAYKFRLPPQTETGTLNVRVGDLTKSVKVEVAPRPELNLLSATITLPEYLQYRKPVMADVRGGAISVLKESVASFEAEVSRELSEATVCSKPAEVAGRKVRALPMRVAESQVIDFRWRDELGLTSKDAFQLKLNAVEDAEPTITIHQQEPQQVVLTTEVITFDVQSRDDFGLRRLGLEWVGLAHPIHNPNPDKGDKMIIAGEPEKKAMTAKATLCAVTDHVPAQTIEVRAYAEDYKPDRGRVYSSAFVLHVMTPEQHAVWMMDQLRRWASLADDVYEEEVRLHDKNRAIRQMDADQINAPEVRRDIEQQAAAERANGERLLSVTDRGDELLRQALRNQEMMVGHLETWAGALQKLRQIGKNRMPSVADMLTQGAKAPGRRSPSAAASTTSVLQAGNHRGQQQGPPDDPKNSGEKQPPVPGVADTESGFNQQSPGDGGKNDAKSGPGKFGVPTTVLEGGPPQNGNQQPTSPAEEKMDEALQEQTDLLAEFQKVRDDLQEIMDDLENSTFVKRFKAASREQLEVASALNRTLFEGFGVSEPKLKENQKEHAERIAVREEGQSVRVRTIQDDLEAYYDRRRDEKFLRILTEMEEHEVVRKLNDLSDRVRENRSGEAIAKAEFWGDTLDRWAEELVSASKCGQCKGCKGDSLPPSIVLEVMRILEGEMDLREETRSLEQAREALEIVKYAEKADAQSETQRALYNRVVSVVTDIRSLPLGEQKFGKEIKLLTAAGAAMNDATDILGQPETGAPAIAAETEAIELLLESKRANPKGGGGGGGSSPGGGGEGNTDQVALELYGPGSDPNAKIESREVRQATGTTTDQTPAEYRDGIDAFFNALESRK